MYTISWIFHKNLRDEYEYIHFTDKFLLNSGFGTIPSSNTTQDYNPGLQL